MTIGLDWAVTFGIALLCTVLGYFLKKRDNSIDALHAKIDTFEERMAKHLGQMCSERQEACALLQCEKITSVRQTQISFCSKLEKLEEQRREDWREQKAWNSRMEDRLNNRERTGGPGR